MNVGDELLAATNVAKNGEGNPGHNVVIGEHGDTPETGTSDLVKAICLVSEYVVLAVGPTPIIERTTIDTFEDKLVVLDTGGTGGTGGTTQQCTNVPI